MNNNNEDHSTKIPTNWTGVHKGFFIRKLAVICDTCTDSHVECLGSFRIAVNKDILPIFWFIDNNESGTKFLLSGT